jgi:glutamate--cysteine ligase
MSLDLAKGESAPLTNAESLERYFRTAEKPAAEHRVGLEHEKLIYPKGGAAAVAYDGKSGIGALLNELAKIGGYKTYHESPEAPVIALMKEQHTITLEPGGQFELSGSPFRTVSEAHRENERHLRELKEATDALGLRAVALGYRPFETLAQMPWMPKRRYDIMRKVMPTRGTLGLDMMLMTATGQASFDWQSEAECARKVTAATRLTPLLIALYANSPLRMGKPSGFASFRAHVWSDVDNPRCGVFSAMLDDSFSYRAYVEWALDAPILFLRRGGEYRGSNKTFRQLMKEGFEGEPLTDADWADHLSTLFPDVRLKRVLEIRGADCVSLEMTGALGALFQGIFTDGAALAAAARLMPIRTVAEYFEARSLASREGLRGRWKGRTFADWGRDLLAVARSGLAKHGNNEANLLVPLEAQVDSGRSPSERVLESFERRVSDAHFLNQFEL